jgi:O-antigen/teichoic acid export membrane protein
VSSTEGTVRSSVTRTGLAIGYASVAGYALLALVGRALPPAEFGLFIAFWGVLFGLGSSLSTLEQEVARKAVTGSVQADPPAWAITTAAGALAGVAGAVTLLPPVAELLYGQSDVRIGLVVLLAALGYAVQFATRGLLMGSGDVSGYSWLVVAEVSLRLAVLIALLLLTDLSLPTAALAVGIGSFAWLGWTRRARVLRPERHRTRTNWRAAAGRAASLMAGTALIASMITGFPTLVTALTDGNPGASGGAVFAALIISRVPLLLIAPLQALAVPYVLRANRDGSGSALRTGLVIGSAISVALGVVAAVVGYVAGPWLVQLMYGKGYEVVPGATALLFFSACLLAWTQLLSAALIGLSAHGLMLTKWILAVAATVTWLVASPLDVVGTTVVGSLIGPATALVVGVPMLWRLARPS